MAEDFENQYPNTYRRVYKPPTNEPFISQYLNQNSVEIDKKLNVRRSSVQPKFSIAHSKVQTLIDVFESGLHQSQFEPCLGYREAVTDPYTWMTYVEVSESIRALGSGLRELTGPKRKQQEFLVMTHENSPEWIITQYACAAYQYVFVPLYPKLDEEMINLVFDQIPASVVICQCLEQAQAILRKTGKSVEYFVLMNGDKHADRFRRENCANLNVLYFDELMASGRKCFKPMMIARPLDVATICYTNGTTGKVKAVTLTHEELTSGYKNIFDHLEGKYFQPCTVHYSYLPLAHASEQTNVALALFCGGKIAFATNGMTTMMDDLKEVQPTIFTAVPKILTQIRLEYYRSVSNAPHVRDRLKILIEKTMDVQNHGVYCKKGFDDWLYFKSFRQSFGGNVCLVICNGSMLSPEVALFFRVAFGCPVVQSYSLTEAAGFVSLNLLGDNELGTSGAILPGLDVRLTDVPEVGIIVSKHKIGQLLLRGARLTKCYQRDEENNQLLFDSEGWLRTGDIGRWTSSGSLQIIGSYKNIIQLSQGYFVSPEKVETIYLSSPLIKSIFLDGNPDYEFTVCIAAVETGEIRKEALRAGIIRGQDLTSRRPAKEYKERSDLELCEDTPIRQLVLNKLNAIGKQRGLEDFEMAKTIHLATEDMTVENGFLTPCMKLARAKLRVHFKRQLEELYKEGELVKN